MVYEKYLLNSLFSEKLDREEHTVKQTRKKTGSTPHLKKTNKKQAANSW